MVNSKRVISRFGELFVTEMVGTSVSPTILTVNSRSETSARAEDAEARPRSRPANSVRNFGRGIMGKVKGGWGKTQRPLRVSIRLTR